MMTCGSSGGWTPPSPKRSVPARRPPTIWASAAVEAPTYDFPPDLLCLAVDDDASDLQRRRAPSRPQRRVYAHPRHDPTDETPFVATACGPFGVSTTTTTTTTPSGSSSPHHRGGRAASTTTTTTSQAPGFCCWTKKHILRSSSFERRAPRTTTRGAGRPPGEEHPVARDDGPRGESAILEVAEYSSDDHEWRYFITTSYYASTAAPPQAPPASLRELLDSECRGAKHPVPC